MSEWLRLLGELKRRAPEEHFTSSQRAAFDTLLAMLQFPGQRINLYGVAGTGKTFVAWGVARATGACHVPTVSRLEAMSLIGYDTLLLDNAPTGEYQVRNLLAKADLHDVSSVVIVTRRPVGLRMKAVELPLPNIDEVHQVLKMLGRLGYYEQRSLPPEPNFWHLLQVCI